MLESAPNWAQSLISVSISNICNQQLKQTHFPLPFTMERHWVVLVHFRPQLNSRFWIVDGKWTAGSSLTAQHLSEVSVLTLAYYFCNFPQLPVQPRFPCQDARVWRQLLWRRLRQNLRLALCGGHSCCSRKTQFSGVPVSFRLDPTSHLRVCFF